MCETTRIKIDGGSAFQQFIAREALQWFLKGDINITVYIGDLENHSGYAIRGNKDEDYVIIVNETLPSFEFLATVFHEAVHVRQWQRGWSWIHKELEARFREYRLANKFTKNYETIMAANS